jgi:protein tyrosine phosphatase (PTP) superfamily phosphohydrolase (DUF442 family)
MANPTPMTPITPTIPTTPKPSRRARKRRWVWAIIAAVVIPIAVKEGDVLFGENFHAVAPGELYRSAQLSPGALESRIKAEGIRTVINLRGSNPGTAWYDNEVRTCERLGVTHIDVRMSARALPPPDEAAALMAALHDAPRPLLVHCKNGADRSGLACAAYRIVADHDDASHAVAEQLSLWYGHVPVGATTAMDRFFTLFERNGGGLTLGQWIADGYPRVYEQEQLTQTTPVGR